MQKKYLYLMGLKHKGCSRYVNRPDETLYVRWQTPQGQVLHLAPLN